MTNDGIEASHPDLRATRRRFRFSIRALLLAIAFGALVISHVYTSQQLQETRQENLLLRQELDRFQVEDEQKLHVAALTSPDRLTWRWRLFVPEGRQFVLRTEHKNLPESGLPTPLGWVGDDLPAGELIVTVMAHKKRSGDWSIITMAPRRRSTFTVPVANSRWLDEMDYTSRQEGQSGVVSYQPGETAMLLRARKSKQLGAGRVTVDMQPTDGLMVWIEERPQKKLTE
ncbi:MAG: hypothetical protein WD894_04115 [Pirellulales bacterium]